MVCSNSVFDKLSQSPAHLSWGEPAFFSSYTAAYKAAKTNLRKRSEIAANWLIWLLTFANLLQKSSH